MAASANPSGNQEVSSIQQKVPSSVNSTANGVAVNQSNNGGTGSGVAAETMVALRHNPGISVHWTSEEQAILEELLAKYASDTNIIRYAKIAMKLKDKTVRDVALRCRWKNPKETGKRRKEDQNSPRKNKDRKERVTDSSPKSCHMTTRPNGPYNLPVMPMDQDDGISHKAIGGVIGDLLEQTSQMLNQISANVANCQIHDNINLLCKARDNIISVMNDSNDAPEIMKLMPPLPVKMNEELANSILPQSSHQTKP